jgi:FixJ family two-component response regulator
MEAGAIGFLTKPCNGKVLHQLIQDVIRQGGEGIAMRMASLGPGCVKTLRLI